MYTPVEYYCTCITLIALLQYTLLEYRVLLTEDTVAHLHPHRHSLCTIPPPASGITMAILGYLHLRPPWSLPV